MFQTGIIMKEHAVEILEEIILQEALAHFNSLTDEKTWSIIHAGVMSWSSHPPEVFMDKEFREKYKDVIFVNKL